MRLVDVQGRRVADVLVGAAREAGPQSAVLPLAGLAPGLYFARFEWEGRAASRRIVVTR